MKSYNRNYYKKLRLFEKALKLDIKHAKERIKQEESGIAIMELRLKQNAEEIKSL